MAMSRYQELLALRADLVNEGSAALATAEKEGRGLTAAEIEADDAREQKLKGINAEIAVLERQRERERSIGVTVPNAPARTTNRSAEAPWGSEFGVEIIQAADGSTRLGGRGFQTSRAAAAVALGSLAIAEHRRATNTGAVDPRLSYNAAVLGLNEGIPQEGGIFLTTEISNEIELMTRTGALLSRVDRATMTGPTNAIRFNMLDETSRATGSRSGGVRAYWLEEGGTKTASTPTFRGVELRAWKIAALGYITDEMLQDVGFLGSFLLDAFSEELRFMAEDAIIRGSGAGMPLGILNAVSNPVIEVAIDSGQVLADGYSFTNITGMWGRLDVRSQSNAVWLVNQAVQPLLQGMTMALGTTAYPVYMPPGGLSTAGYGTLFGRPVVPVEYMPAPGTPGDIMLADLSQYRFVEKGGIQTASSIHVQFVTDQTAFRAVWRVGGAPKWISPLTPYQGTDTVSPFITLAVRS